MLLPLIGFIAGVFVSAILGVIVIALHPKWKISLANVALFVVGSFFTTFLTSYTYTKLLTDENGQLQSIELVLGFFGVLALAVIGGGIISTYLGRRILKMD